MSDDRIAKDCFETVAVVYSRPEAAVMLSMFAFYGIPVQTVGAGHAAVNSVWMVALGGIIVRVSHGAADEARILLAEVAEKPAVVRPRLIANSVLNGVIVVLACAFGLAPVPPTRSGSTFSRVLSSRG